MIIQHIIILGTFGVDQPTFSTLRQVNLMILSLQNKYIRILPITLLVALLSSCGDEDWYCKIDGDIMYSVSESGKLGGVEKGCSCSQIRDFEYDTFGFIDEDALNDAGC